MSKEKKEKKVRTRGSLEIRREKNKELTDFLKSLIFPTVFCGLIALGVYCIIHFVNPEKEKETIVPNGFTGGEDPIVMETDELLFTMDPLTTRFTVEQKATGKVWSSFVEDVSTETIAMGSEKAKLQSNVLLDYSIKTGLETIYDSKTFSVDKGIYDVVQNDDGSIKLLYSLGNVEREYVVPTVIRQTDLDALREKMEKKSADMVKDVYKKYNIKKLKKSDNKEELLANYPILATDPIYVLRDNTKEQRKASIEKALEAAGYTYEQYQADKELDLSSTTSEASVFNMEMDLRLENGDLVVEIPMDSLEYDPDTPIYTITPFPYFGAAGKNEDGFLLVPEGGGSLINYNNGKTNQSDYYANVYGWDMCLSREYVIHNTRAYFNVFGQSNGDSSYICIMEDGSSYGSVQASVSGRINCFNFVNSVYSICSREKFNIQDVSNSDIYSYLTELPAGEKIVQRYRFVNSGDYVDMAYAYRDYLENKYGASMTINEDTSAPVAVELLGAVDKVQQVFGIPMSLPLKLTGYKDADLMIGELDSLNIGKLSVKYSGWCNGGVSQKILKKIKPVKALGSRKDLQELCASAKSRGVNLYLDGITQYEHRSNIFNGFNSFKDAARFLTKERAEQFNFSHITYMAREGYKSYYLLHTPLAIEMANNLANACASYDAGISFQDVGMDLSSDFYRKDRHSREDAKKQNEELLKALDAKGSNVMINMGNDYAVPYVDMVTNMDLKGSEYTMIDETVPFYQIAVHGYVDYTGNPLNICGNDQEELLSCVEYGAGLQFTLMNESSFTLQKTMYPEYYGAEYASWKDRMVEICTRYNEELGHTFNQEMTDHEILSDYARATTYADGTKVYVNYSFTDEYTADDGTVVPVRDYVVIR